jgi:hypothetical protein
MIGSQGGLMTDRDFSPENQGACLLPVTKLA